MTSPPNCNTSNCRPTPATLNASDILWQVNKDLIGKEVQDPPTYSYTWMADQSGHLFLGLLPIILCDWGQKFWDKPDIICDIKGSFGIFGFLLVPLVVILCWGALEAYDYRKAVSDAKNHFPFDKQDVLDNAILAVKYFALGACLGAVFHYPISWVGFIALVLLVVLIIAFAPYWLKQKIRFQRATLPSLFRLADFGADRFRADDPGKAGATAIWGFLARAFKEAGLPGLAKWLADGKSVGLNVDPDQKQPRHLAIFGPIKSGKTSLASGIGSEFSFAEGKVRYISFIKFLQVAVEGEDIQPQRTVRIWPWCESQLLIIDDVDPGIGARPAVIWSEGKTAAIDPDQPAQAIITPDEFVRVLTGLPGKAIECLRARPTAWVMGDTGNPNHVAAWIAALETVLGKDDVAQVHLKPATQPYAKPRTRR